MIEKQKSEALEKASTVPMRACGSYADIVQVGIAFSQFFPKMCCALKGPFSLVCAWSVMPPPRSRKGPAIILVRI